MSPSQWLLCHSKQSFKQNIFFERSFNSWCFRVPFHWHYSRCLVWSYLPPRGVSTGLSMCLTNAEQLKQNIFFNFCCFWILPFIISKIHGACSSYLPPRGVSTGLSMCLRWSRLSCRLGLETTFWLRFIKQHFTLWGEEDVPNRLHFLGSMALTWGQTSRWTVRKISPGRFGRRRLEGGEGGDQGGERRLSLDMRNVLSFR